MTDEAKKNRLGRGLSALLGDSDLEVSGSVEESMPASELPVAFIEANPDQPRRAFDENELDDLAASIREHGVLQPIIVRPIADATDRYQIVAGERRWRAAQRAAIHNVPVIVRDFSDADVLEISLIENIQRSDLNAIEEAEGYRALMEQFGHTQERLSEVIGKSRSHIANLLRLLSLPQRLKTLVINGQLSAGHARALLSAPNPEAIADQVLSQELNVRQTEALAKGGPEEKPAEHRKAPSSKPEKDPDTLALERNVSNALGLGVSINHKGENGGEVRVSYSTLEQLDDICRRLSRDH